MLTQTFPGKACFKGGSSFIILFRNRETEPWKLIKISSLTWEGKTSSKNFFQRKMNRCEGLLFVPQPTALSCPERFFHREISPGLTCFLGKQNFPMDLSCFSFTGFSVFFPKKQRNQRSKGRSHVEIQSIHPSCHPCAIKLSHISRGDTRAI